MGCMQSKEESNWDEQTKQAVAEVTEWGIPEATKAARDTAFAGGDSEQVMAAANAAKEEAEKKEEQVEDDMPETAPEEPEASPEGIEVDEVAEEAGPEVIVVAE